MPSVLSIPGPFLAFWNYIKVAAATDRVKRDLRAETDLLDALRHADFNSHKYVISLYMKSGRTIVGRIGTGNYSHRSYDKHRGMLTIAPEREHPDGVFYELCEVRLSEVEGYLLQDVNYDRPEVMKRLREDAEANSITVGTAPSCSGRIQEG